jgi:undecaprenyl-diphosphatase
MDHWWQPLILGIVEGLTEYLPVSSTAHILLAQRLLGIEQNEASDAYAVVIQAGAILAVLGIYSRRVWEMLQGLAGKNPAGLRLAIQIIVAFLPAAIIGVLFNKKIKEHLFHLWPICGAWFIGGLVILAFAAWMRRNPSRGRSIAALTIRGAFVIGLLQCLGMIPGTSRSLVTILGGLIVGLNMAAALEFSFLLGLVTLTAATVHDGYKHGHAMMAAYDPSQMAIGCAAAAVAAFVAVKWMILYLQRNGLAVFGWYRIALAIVVAGLILSEKLVI